VDRHRTCDVVPRAIWPAESEKTRKRADRRRGIVEAEEGPADPNVEGITASSHPFFFQSFGNRGRHSSDLCYFFLCISLMSLPVLRLSETALSGKSAYWGAASHAILKNQDVSLFVLFYKEKQLQTLKNSNLRAPLTMWCVLLLIAFTHACLYMQTCAR